jgi:hypothetical protein
VNHSERYVDGDVHTVSITAISTTSWTRC